MSKIEKDILYLYPPPSEAGAGVMTFPRWSVVRPSAFYIARSLLLNIMKQNMQVGICPENFFALDQIKKNSGHY